MNPFTLIFGPIVNAVSGYVNRKMDIAAAKDENTARLLRDEQNNNHAWEMASLVDKDKWLRRISFFLFTWPFVVAGFYPDAVAEYYKTIQVIPEWNRQLVMAMVGGIWGIAELKNSLPALINSLRKPDA